MTYNPVAVAFTAMAAIWSLANALRMRQVQKGDGRAYTEPRLTEFSMAASTAVTP